jgi:hypothetical protein
MDLLNLSGAYVSVRLEGGTKMSLSPLAEQIYQTLVRRLRFPDPLISYGDLVRALGPLPPPYTDLEANDKRLFDALAEILRACQNHKPPLPALTSIVVRRTADGGLGTPGAGYFAQLFPWVREEIARLEMWREEVKRVVAFPYPEELSPPGTYRPTEPRMVPGWLREPTVIAAILGLVGTLLTVIASVWISARRDESPQQRQPDRPTAKIIAKSDTPSRSHVPELPEEKRAPQGLMLDEILDVLERHHQRATFGAVAGILGREPRSLFKGSTRTPRTAWVVNKTTGLPTGTKASDYPPGLLQKERVIDMIEDLRAWLRENQ